MARRRDHPESLREAENRFKQGLCPDCGKGFGASRGLEYREKRDDVYCHTCKKAWPVEMDFADLEKRISLYPQETLAEEVDLVQNTESKSGGILKKAWEFIKRIWAIQ
jgi:transcription elongation factor Elf1